MSQAQTPSWFRGTGHAAEWGVGRVASVPFSSAAERRGCWGGLPPGSTGVPRPPTPRLLFRLVDCEAGVDTACILTPANNMSQCHSPRSRPFLPRRAVMLLFLAAAAILPACRTVPSYSPFDPPRYAEPRLEDFAVLLYIFDWVDR